MREATHILNEVQSGTQLEVTEVVTDGHPEIEVGDVFTVDSTRTRGDLPDGSTPSCKWLAEADHEMPHLGVKAQLKSVNDDNSLVIVPDCQGGSRVRVEAR